MNDETRASRSPWSWIPSLYFAEGLPNAVVAGVSVLLYKRLGISNTDVALYTSWIYLPWVLKSLWSPFVDILGTRRNWIWAMQVLVGAALAGVALALPGPGFLRWSLACFWLAAFNSATHDIAADGFYMLATRERQQAFFVGYRNASYQLAAFAVQGPLLVLVDRLTAGGADAKHAWAGAMGLVAAALVLLGLWHRFVLPRPAADRPGGAREAAHILRAYLGTFGSFFRKPGIGTVLAFLLLYRLGEAQLVKMTVPFLVDPATDGGLGLSNTAIGFLTGTVGVLALLAGGILGGMVVSRHGLRAWLWPMLFAIHLPDLAFLWMAWAQPHSMAVIAVCVGIEKFGYGFGFVAYTVYMLYVSRGEHRTAHYAICTGFMAAGLMLPGMWSGWLVDHLGYRRFFAWVLFATVPSFLVALRLPLEAGFARKEPA